MAIGMEMVFVFSFGKGCEGGILRRILMRVGMGFWILFCVMS